MPTGHIFRSEPRPLHGAAGFEPSAALAILDELIGGGRDAQADEAQADAAWDAAWIACLTNSPRWAETARREFARAAVAAPTLSRA